MITITYISENNFDIGFIRKKYIPEHYFKILQNGYGAELYFYLDLLHENGMFGLSEYSVHQLIWSVDYDCHYKDTAFKLMYDEDYDFVIFHVVNPAYTKEIAERIKMLIEEKFKTII